MNPLSCPSVVAPHALLSVTTTWTRTGVRVLTADGEIDVSSVAVLSRALALATAEAPAALVLDLGRVRFLSAAGVDVVAGLFTRGRRDGFAVRVVASTRLVRRVLSLVGLDQVLVVHDTLDAALNSLAV